MCTHRHHGLGSAQTESYATVGNRGIGRVWGVAVELCTG